MKLTLSQLWRSILGAQASQIDHTLNILPTGQTDILKAKQNLYLYVSSYFFSKMNTYSKSIDRQQTS